MRSGVGLAPLPPKLARLTDDPAFIPTGYGFRPLGVGEMLDRAKLGELLEVFQQFEPPLRGHRYVISADVSGGLGKDRSSVDVIRVPTIERIEEQVGHFISDRVQPRELAFVIDALGHMYCDDDGLEALAAIETNNHGLSTQDTLQLHLGYTHFYRWEYLDSMDPAARFTNRVGWYTTTRTRPMLLDHFREAVTTFDPVTKLPDLRINSPWTLGELADFQTDGALWEAEAAAGAHDDCILSLAIGHYVTWRLMGGESEPLADRRRRRHQREQRQSRLDADQKAGRDYRNMPYTEAELSAQELGQGLDEEAELEQLYDVRGVEYDTLE